MIPLPSSAAAALPSALRRTGPAPGVLAGLAGAALLAACATPPDPPGATPQPGPPAAPPAAAPRSAATAPAARLLLRGAVAAEDRFAALLYSDPMACQGPRQLVAGVPQKTPEPVMLPAGVLTTLDFVILRNDKPSCSVRWSFTPLAGRTYLLQGLVIGGGCSARLADASQPDRPQPVADAVLRSAPGQPCLPLAQARALAAAGASIQGGQHNGEAVLNPRASTQGLEGLIRP